MFHLLALVLLATIAYAGVYTLLGWFEVRFVRHYMQIASSTSLGGPAQAMVRWLLCGVLILALSSWVTVVVSAAFFATRGFPWYFALPLHCVVFVITCLLVLLIVWTAFHVGSECTLIVPEFLVAIAMMVYLLEAVLPQLQLPWREVIAAANRF